MVVTKSTVKFLSRLTNQPLSIAILSSTPAWSEAWEAIEFSTWLAFRKLTKLVAKLTHLTIGSPKPTVVDQKESIILLDGSVEPGNEVPWSPTTAGRVSSTLSSLFLWGCSWGLLGSWLWIKYMNTKTYKWDYHICIQEQSLILSPHVL